MISNIINNNNDNNSDANKNSFFFIRKEFNNLQTSSNDTNTSSSTRQTSKRRQRQRTNNETQQLSNTEQLYINISISLFLKWIIVSYIIFPFILQFILYNNNIEFVVMAFQPLNILSNVHQSSKYNIINSYSYPTIQKNSNNNNNNNNNNIRSELFRRYLTKSSLLSSTILTTNVEDSKENELTLTDEIKSSNDVSDTTTTITNKVGQISPWHILLKYDPSINDDDDDITMKSIINRSYSLQSSLLLFTNVLKQIINQDDNNNNNSSIINNILNNNAIIYNNIKVIRIEIPIIITSIIDPLAWLYSQEIYISKQLDNTINTIPSMFYLNTHESNIEVATIGSSIQYNTTFNLFNNIYNILPKNSLIYGGHRFDHNKWNNNDYNNNYDNNKIDSEWNVFGQALWMLPTIELRKQQTITTFAIHLVCTNNESWTNVAKNIYNNLFQYISSIQSEHVPPTTLPPILSRNTKFDGQELYEKAFDAAMYEFSIDNNNNNNTTNMDNKDKNILQKVVLARQQTLKFGTYLTSSLDIIRRWKYGGHEGGHLFWIKPEINNNKNEILSSSLSTISYEFLGCTPERLFQINTNIKTNITSIRSEALAGTRPRGSSQYEDELLLQELWSSPKDRRENELTGQFIQNAFDELYSKNIIKQHSSSNNNVKLIDDNNNDVSKSDVMSSTTMDNDLSTTSSSVTLPLSVTRQQQPSLWAKGFFVRRLLHLQHICQSFTAELVNNNNNNNNNTDSKMQTQTSLKATQFLLSRLHPTPAVCGVPSTKALDFIQKYESIGFDRGFYSGPIGYIGHNEADILVAIRSGLAITTHKEPDIDNAFSLTRTRKSNFNKRTELSVYAGGGIVPGSKLRDEWAETNYKFAVVSSLFSQSPVTLRSATTPNVAWATAFIEELIRNGITRFYICPGSRSTPLVVAIARAVRANSVGGSGGGIIQAVSVLDERSAAFRCLGYAKGNGRPAVIVTSSGTAVANLYPAIIEASMDGIPMLVLTADRPYESRDSGANQAIDQVKVFSSSYIRWFRDVLPPSDDVPVSLALSDASHAVSVCRQLRGPVHVNLQFRENLAPDSGKIRNDNRIDSITKYNGMRFTDVPGFRQWSKSGDKWSKSYSYYDSTIIDAYHSTVSTSSAALDVARLIQQSKRGIIVVGNLRIPTSQNVFMDQASIAQTIADFAETIGFPIFAGVQSGNLRFVSSAVVPFSEHLLKCPVIFNNLDPDLIIQIGAPLVSSGISDLIASTMKKKHKGIDSYGDFSEGNSQSYHVMIHPHVQHERLDPSFTITHKVSAEIAPFLTLLSNTLQQGNQGDGRTSSLRCSSQLSPLVRLGRKLQNEMKSIINDASYTVSKQSKLPSPEPFLAEPQIIVALSELLAEDQESGVDRSLFLSNSMPVRDAEFFLYPYSSEMDSDTMRTKKGFKSIGVNRGASGIDGIISSALGYTESTKAPTTLLIGDVATLHDIGSFHSVVDSALTSNQIPAKKRGPLVTIVVNNDGGGIFSFLPIAQHGDDVAFDQFFGTPTNSFSFERGAKAFGLEVERATDFTSFIAKYKSILRSEKDYVLEAVVANRAINVEVHKHITKLVQSFVDQQLTSEKVNNKVVERLPIKTYSHGTNFEEVTNFQNRRVMVLLHGWMGDKSEWDDVASHLMGKLSPDWVVVSIDLPGHGGSVLRKSNDAQVFRNALKLSDKKYNNGNELDIDAIAGAVIDSLLKHYQISHIDAISGYSAGGRVALAMERLCSPNSPSIDDTYAKLIDSSTALILLGAYPGDLALPANPSRDMLHSKERYDRVAKDDLFATQIESLCDKACIQSTRGESKQIWNSFLSSWYANPMWGSLNKNRLYNDMISRRTLALHRRGRDIAAFLSQCSPPRNNQHDWRFCSPQRTLYITGQMDIKYANTGMSLQRELSWRVEEVEGVGHALLIQAPEKIADLIADFTCADCDQSIRTEVTDKVLEIINVTEAATPSTFIKSESKNLVVDLENSISIGLLELKAFSISLSDKERNENQVFGVGWGEDAKAKLSQTLSTRDGFIIQLDASNGLEVGIGEVSPLKGLHPESIEEAKTQILLLQEKLENAPRENRPSFNPQAILELRGSMHEFLVNLEDFANIDRFLPSVRSGLEMSLLALASQKISLPIHQALGRSQFDGRKPSTASSVHVCGLITRASSSRRALLRDTTSSRKFPSVKVKVGHQLPQDDAISMLHGFQVSELYHGRSTGYVRADANRAWNESQAIEFALALEGLDVHALDRIEFVEEPLEKHLNADGWNLSVQVDALERTFFRTGIHYALDESIADLVAIHGYEVSKVEEELRTIFSRGPRGCAAFVLKPALLGFEVSVQLARLGRTELGIGAVFSSCFDSGIGLAYAAFLGNLANQMPSTSQLFPHGIGTFTLLDNDTMSPAFETFVNENGILNVPSLSRALYGLSLDEMHDLDNEVIPLLPKNTGVKSSIQDYEASTATSSSGKEISVVVNLPLPFSAETACLRFTDLPSMSRWSPWISSVQYKGTETEWSINIKGIQLKWRATSALVYDPYPGIQWQSVSGLINNGIVEFIAISPTSCTMNVRMTIVTPRLLKPLFQGTSVFVEEFLRDKLLKWSLEMFRDVVKADLAIERGDVELGDALIGAVEGKASAIEATLNSTSF